MSDVLTITGSSKESADQFWFKDANGNKVEIANIGTKVELVVVSCTDWSTKASESKWYTMLHCGVIFSENTFNINGENYEYCLTHALNNGKDCKKTLIKIQGSNRKADLVDVLKSYLIGIEEPTTNPFVKTWQKALGESKVKISYALQEVKPQLEKEFAIAVIKRNLQQCNYPLLPDNMTNCVQVAYSICKAVCPEATDTGVHNTESVIVLAFTESCEVVINLWNKYRNCKPKWSELKGLVVVLVKYTRGVATAHTEKAKMLLQKICKMCEESTDQAALLLNNLRVNAHVTGVFAAAMARFFGNIV